MKYNNKKLISNGNCAHYFDNRYHGDDAWLSKTIGRYSVLDVVLDGVSTGNGGKASSFVKEKLKKYNITEYEEIIRLLQEANSELYEEGKGWLTTKITVSFKKENTLHLINAGDSPAYLIRDGKIIEISTPDRDSKKPNVVTSVVGMEKCIDYHLNEIELKPYDRLILATDGITDNVYPDEILKIVSSKTTPKEAIEDLKELMKIKRATKKGRHDVFGLFKEDDATARIRYF